MGHPAASPCPSAGRAASLRLKSNQRPPTCFPSAGPGPGGSLSPHLAPPVRGLLDRGHQPRPGGPPRPPVPELRGQAGVQPHGQGLPEALSGQGQPLRREGSGMGAHPPMPTGTSAKMPLSPTVPAEGGFGAGGGGAPELPLNPSHSQRDGPTPSAKRLLRLARPPPVEGPRALPPLHPGGLFWG